MKVLLIAQINGLELDTIPSFDIITDTKTEEYLAKFPMGQSPGFEAKNGVCLVESAAIATHTAELKKDTIIFRKTTEDCSKVFQFIFNNETQVDKFASVILYTKLGYMKHTQNNQDLSCSFLDRDLTYYNTLLESKSYFVGDQLTLADVFLFFTLYNLYKVIIDEERKVKFENVTKFMNKLSKDERFAKVLGNDS